MKGWKTITGAVGYALCTGAAAILPDYSEFLLVLANAIFLPLGGVGLAHKIEKAGSK